MYFNEMAKVLFWVSNSGNSFTLWGKFEEHRDKIIKVFLPKNNIFYLFFFCENKNDEKKYIFILLIFNDLQNFDKKFSNNCIFSLVV
jgi:hypothetical protein